MKTRHILLLVTPLLLSSCVGDNFTGTYSFQLGKDKETHMSAYMKLTNNDYHMEVEDPDTHEKKDTVKGKEYTLDMSMDFGASDISGVIGDVSENLDQVEQEEGSTTTDIHLKGYYIVGDKRKDGSNELRLSVDLNGPEGEDIQLEDKLIESVIFATVTRSEVKVEIPVSVTDLALQLYWYGWDIDFETFEISYREEHGEFGIHPTADEIKKINDDGFGEKHKVPFLDEPLTFRDFNTVHIGLSKE